MKWLILLLLLVACSPMQTPEKITLLKDACNTCESESVVSLTLDAGATLYTTEDAICIKSGNMLSCGTCSCTMKNTTLATGPANLTCTFSPQQGFIC